MRRKITTPTYIYWLVDVRPETLTRFPNGRPFYCGKTIREPSYRLACHVTISRRFPSRLISKRLHECGNDVRITVVEIVPFDTDWAARERRWIQILRHAFPGGANVTDGGAGSPGYVHTEEACRKIQRALLSKKKRRKRRTPTYFERKIKHRTTRKVMRRRRMTALSKIFRAELKSNKICRS